VAVGYGVPAVNVSVDEAIYRPGDGVYVLAAVLVPDEAKNALRRELRRVPPGGRRRLHWHHEANRERFATLRLAAAHAAGLLAYRWSPAPSRTHETIRGQLLTTLAAEIAKRRALELVIEGRQERNDHADRTVLAQAQRDGDVPWTLSYGHRTPLEEPLLWLPDALAGAALSGARGDTRYVEALGSAVAITELP
jgi:hypothetical protein